MGPKTTMLQSKKPVVAVTAVRTGVGKARLPGGVPVLKERGKQVVAIRHPMPYGDLNRSASALPIIKISMRITVQSKREKNMNRISTTA